jgi:hypothetical protein
MSGVSGEGDGVVQGSGQPWGTNEEQHEVQVESAPGHGLFRIEVAGRVRVRARAYTSWSGFPSGFNVMSGCPCVRL